MKNSAGAHEGQLLDLAFLKPTNFKFYIQDLRQREIVNLIKSATKLALKRLFEVPLIFWETFKWHQNSDIEKRRIRSYAMELLKRQQQANSIQWKCNGYILSFDHRSRHKNTRQSSDTIATGGDRQSCNSVNIHP